MTEKLLSPKEASNILNVTLTTLRNWSEEGKLKHTKLPSGHRRYPEGEIMKLAKTFIKTK